MIMTLILTLGGMLIATTLAVITLYWGREKVRPHIIGISVSYLVMTGLAMQPYMVVPLWPAAHTLLVVAAELVGIAALWLLIYEVARKRFEGAGEDRDA